MRQYELTIILKSNLDESQRLKFIEKIEGLIKKEKGKITKVDQWGKRNLAYPIKKQPEGFYLFFNLEVDEKTAVSLNQKLNLDEEILRYLLIRKD